MQTLKANVKGRAIANAREQARLETDVGIATPLSGVDDLSGGLTGSQQQQLDRQLATIRQANGVQRVIVRNATGRTVYADDHSLVGQNNPSSSARNAALGSISSDMAGGGVPPYPPPKIQRARVGPRGPWPPSAPLPP